jgi:hypothetical protein
LLFEDCLVEDNAYGLRLGPGAAGVLDVRGCTIRNNHDDGIYGVMLSGGAPVTVEDCVVEGNENGLRLNFSNPAASVRNCVVRGNAGSGIRFRSGTIEGCTIQGNDGGVYLWGAALLRDCLVTGNATGGIRAEHATVTIEGCTIASNGSLPWSFGGLAVAYSDLVTVRRSILWENCASGGYDVYVTQWATLDMDCANVDPARIAGPGTVILGEDILAEDPRFCDPVDCTQAPTAGGLYTLADDSPALAQPCGVMGALGAGCTLTAAGANLESARWGSIKSLYR